MVKIEFPKPTTSTYYTGDPSKWPNGVYVKDSHPKVWVISVLNGCSLAWSANANVPPVTIGHLSDEYTRLPAGTRTTFTFVFDN